MIQLITLSDGQMALFVKSNLIADSSELPSIESIAQKLTEAFSLPLVRVAMDVPDDDDWSWQDVYENCPANNGSPASGARPCGDRYFESTFIVSVLSQDRPVHDMNLDALATAMRDDLVGEIASADYVELAASEAAARLHEMSSEPGFFQLRDDGSSIDDEPEEAATPPARG